MKIPDELVEAVRLMSAELGVDLPADDLDRAMRRIEQEPSLMQAEAVGLIRAYKENHAMTDPIPAVQAEAQNVSTIDVDWDGVSVTLPAKPDDWELDTLEAFEQGKAATAVRGVLGKSYNRVITDYKARHGRPPKVSDLESFMQTFAKAYGFEDAGE